MKSNIFIISSMAKIKKADNLLYINQFIKRDITESINQNEKDI